MNDSKTWRLFRRLAQGGFHSGEALARELGVSRAAVWKLKFALEAMGVGIHAVRGRGYRIDPPLELLDRDRLLRYAPDLRVEQLRIDTAVDSTHLRLNAWLEQGDIESGCACLAEYQAKGRGRRARSWHSPPGQNLYLSLYWRFESAPTVFTGLSLALGLAVAEVLEAWGVTQVGLKWPNDVQVRGRKLAGLLVDLRSQGGGPADVLVGVGCNYHMQGQPDIGQPWTDLHRCLIGKAPGRNECAGAFLQALYACLRGYDPRRFPTVRQAWARFDALDGKRVRVHVRDGECFEGVARGLAEDGALRIEGDDGRIRAFASGEVSVRAAAGEPHVGL